MGYPEDRHQTHFLVILEMHEGWVHAYDATTRTHITLPLVDAVVQPEVSETLSNDQSDDMETDNV